MLRKNIDIQLNIDNCIKCGSCARECSIGVISWKAEEYPEVVKAEQCFECGRCMARCMHNAIKVGEYSNEDFITIPQDKLIEPETMENFLLSKRSCRKYQDKPIEKGVLEKLLKVAQMAPTTMNCEEKTYKVIQDKKVIDKIRKSILKHTKGMLSMMKFFTSKPISVLFPKDTIAFFNRMVIELKLIKKHSEQGNDPLFYDASCLVLFTGIGMSPMGKDNALAGMHYFMLMAESMGLGSCISGFIQSAPQKVAKIVNVPKYYKIYGAIMLGYPAAPFTKTILRHEPEVNWI